MLVYIPVLLVWTLKTQFLRFLENEPHYLPHELLLSLSGSCSVIEWIENCLPVQCGLCYFYLHLDCFSFSWIVGYLLRLRAWKDEKMFSEAQRVFAPVPPCEHMGVSFCWVASRLSNQTFQFQSTSVFSNPISCVFWPGSFQNRSRVYIATGKDFFLIRKTGKALQWYKKLNCFSVLIKRLHWTRGFPLKLITSHIRVVLSNIIKL